MGLNGIWTKDGEWLEKSSEDFGARSTGCSCCSSELDTEDEVYAEALDSLAFIVRAKNYFGWYMPSMLLKADRLIRLQNKGEKTREVLKKIVQESKKKMNKEKIIKEFAWLIRGSYEGIVKPKRFYNKR